MLRNAIDALARHPSESGRVTISTQIKPDMVEDNGPGVDPTVTLFNTFDTQKTDGMGLGLSICRTIVKANGGEIRYEPTEDGSARFCFTLRRSDFDEEEE